MIAINDQQLMKGIPSEIQSNVKELTQFSRVV